MPCPARHRLSLFALLLLTLPLARAESYRLDPVHTRVAFQVSHAGFSNPVGSFSGTTGILSFDQADWSKARLSATIQIATLDLGDGNWQEKILDRTFFDAQKFPVAQFVSTRIESSDNQHAQVTGDLTLHGITLPVTLSVTLNASKRHPLTLKKTVGFSATGTLSRKQFGMTAWSSVVGDEVHLIIEAEAVRSQADAGDEAPATIETTEPANAPAQ